MSTARWAGLLSVAVLVALTWPARAASDHADAIVIGAGPGGLATTLEAARGRARVIVIDVASVFGGHAVVSEGGLSFAGTPLQKSLGYDDSPAQMLADIERLAATRGSSGRGCLPSAVFPTSTTGWRRWA